MFIFILLSLVGAVLCLLATKFGEIVYIYILHI